MRIEGGVHVWVYGNMSANLPLLLLTQQLANLRAGQTPCSKGGRAEQQNLQHKMTPVLTPHVMQELPPGPLPSCSNSSTGSACVSKPFSY
jgi:hypothetical protein